TRLPRGAAAGDRLTNLRGALLLQARSWAGLRPALFLSWRMAAESALCRKRTRALQQKKWLFDHLVGAGEAVLGGGFRARGPENVGGLRRFVVAISSRRGSAGDFPSRKPPRGGRGSLPQSRQFGDQEFRSKKSAR